ncbi:MAG: DUF3048 domain-containing protein [Eubacterium sp.]
MPDSDELDDILNEIKGFKNSEPENEAEPKAFADEEKPAESETPKSDFAEEEAVSQEEKVEEIPFVSLSESNNEGKENEEDRPMSEEKKSNNTKKTKKKYPIIAAVAIALIVVIACVVFFVVGKNKDAEETTVPTEVSQVTEAVTEAPVSTKNPLTGDSDFNSEAVGKRPIACVVENSAASRPQWGINDSDNPPDIIVEGEVEGGETRMLWMYADYTAVPSQIGPMRSARPPYIKFSELFDAIFLHWGQSQTKKGTAYIGANTVFRVDNVDHINQMTYSGKVALFGRDSSRGVSTEHTGVLYGDKIAAAIEGEGFRTEADNAHYTKFNFSDDVKYDTDCQSLGLTFSSRTGTRSWSYSSDDGMYHCNDYNTDVARKNLLVLFDTTEYISKANYKNSGSAEIYCNYNLAGGSGKLACNGTVTDITWSVENGVIVLKDASGADINLNVGTTWIGYASSNNGGAVK